MERGPVVEKGIITDGPRDYFDGLLNGVMQLSSVEHETFDFKRNVFSLFRETRQTVLSLVDDNSYYQTLDTSQPKPVLFTKT